MAKKTIENLDTAAILGRRVQVLDRFLGHHILAATSSMRSTQRIE